MDDFHGNVKSLVKENKMKKFGLVESIRRHGETKLLWKDVIQPGSCLAHGVVVRMLLSDAGKEARSWSL